MAEETPLKRGNALLAEGDHSKAIEAFQEALKADPTADVNEALARAYIKGEQYMEAAEAALKAVTLDPSLAKAYLRRGIALFHLEEFESALEAFQKGKELRPTLAAFSDWIRKCDVEIKGEVEEIQPPPASGRPEGGPKITFVNAPPRPASEPPSESPPGSPVAACKAPALPKQAQDGISLPIAPSGEVPAPNKIRHQWYQLGDKVVVDVYAKALAPDRFSAQFSDTRLKLSVARAPASSSDDAAAGRDAAAAGNSDAAAAAGDKEGAAAGGDAEGGAAGEEGPEWELDVELYGPVEAAACRFEVLRTKVEVTLKKAPPLRAWPTLERSDKPALPVPAPAPAPAPKPAAAADAAAAAPGAAEAGPPLKYPSSYVKAPKDWSALEKEVKEMESKGELDEGDPLNSFFQKIFSQGDEDTRRAMMKSFVESNGTVLSTNWDEVGKKKVECTPPEGMEVHKWTEK